MGFTQDPVSGKLTANNDISGFTGQLQKLADMIDYWGSISVATAADLDALPYKKTGMLAFVENEDAVYRYFTSWKRLTTRKLIGLGSSPIINNGAGATVRVLFPDGTFTDPSKIRVFAVSGSSRLNISVPVGGISLTGADVRFDNRSGATAGSDTFTWTAEQVD